MNDSLIRKFCESRYRWPIVATATLLLGLVALLPQVDDYCDKRNSHNVLTEDLDLASETADSLPKFEGQVAELAQKLDRLEARAIDDQKIGEFRNQVVDVARKAGCQVRRIEVANVVSRPWKENDRPVAGKRIPVIGRATPFVLQRRSVVLTVDGPMASIHQLLVKIQEENTLAHPHRLSLRSSSRSGMTTTLEIELWLFSLRRQAA